MTRAGLASVLPGLGVLSGYQKKDLGHDILAGLVICLVLIPSALAYADLAGFGPMAGIYSAIAAWLIWGHPLRGELMARFSPAIGRA